VGNFSASMLYTIGTALDRAREQGHQVELLVDATWLSGLVVGLDGTGVVLEGREDEFAVVRLERVAAVRVLAAYPHRRRINGAEAPVNGFDDSVFDGAMPMPGPTAG